MAEGGIMGKMKGVWKIENERVRKDYCMMSSA
jgi:hypothetical protein